MQERRLRIDRVAPSPRFRRSRSLSACRLTGGEPITDRGSSSDAAPTGRSAPPDLVAYAESFGAHGVHIEAAVELLPPLEETLAHHTVMVIAGPVDYAVNLRVTQALGEFDGSLS
jgi:hypothetical protein